MTAPSEKIRDLAASLVRLFSVDAIASKSSYSKVKCEYDESTILKEIWTEFLEQLKTVGDRVRNRRMHRLADTHCRYLI